MTRRLLFSYLTLAVLVLIGLEVPFGAMYASGERNRFSAMVEKDARTLASFTSVAIDQDMVDRLPSVADQYARNTGGRMVIVNRNGQVLANSDPNRAAGLDPKTIWEFRKALGGSTVMADRRLSDGSGELYIATPVTTGSVVRGAVRLTVPTRVVDARVHRVWFGLALVGLVMLASTVVLAFALARWITGPLRALERATEELAGGSLDAPASTRSGPPELRRLAVTFNHTARRLAHLLRAQRAFAGDASHQLKTPLTALRLRLENLEPDISPEARPTLDAAMTETDRLASMVEGLLALARLEDNATTVQTVDLDCIVNDRATFWVPLARAKRVGIAVVGNSVGHVWAVPGALEQIIDNLVSNALRASPADSTITIARSVRPPRAGADQSAFGGQTVELRVIDQGPGMTAEQRQRAFDRFWRAPDAPKGGSGLGLTIVQRLANASGGRVTLQAASGGGLDAVVTLQNGSAAVRELAPAGAPGELPAAPRHSPVLPAPSSPAPAPARHASHRRTEPVRAGRHTEQVRPGRRAAPRAGIRGGIRVADLVPALKALGNSTSNSTSNSTNNSTSNSTSNSTNTRGGARGSGAGSGSRR